MNKRYKFYRGERRAVPSLTTMLQSTFIKLLSGVPVVLVFKSPTTAACVRAWCDENFPEQLRLGLKVKVLKADDELSSA